ncbi:Zinc/iron-chelating domain-containing protein [Candidatus Desulfarcum epimagneticum]|uniref:Zinc/iron-chelating domain-containing protein n=1 Tax=uncultured Desulfobacteraceae bacterium TaxID=218296 RepID=A0A484HFT4_9BACT|nr:Zinc/iron-chelating domain-containing protein [uncultured Desulfobacteraceae bacterium]
MTQNEMEPIDAREAFCFSCGPDVPCFNECCRDLSQSLTPYDALRLRNRLEMASREFIERFGLLNTGPATGLPVLTLGPADEETLLCPFVTPDGCAVYEDRPSSCRMYPLARAVSRSRETGETAVHYALVKEAHCRGFEKGGSRTPEDRTPEDWIRDQGLSEYNRLNDLMLEIISLKNTSHPGPLGLAAQKMAHMAFYDLDSFKALVFEQGGHREIDAPSELMDAARQDDVKLLELAMVWLKAGLF